MLPRGAESMTDDLDAAIGECDPADKLLTRGGTLMFRRARPGNYLVTQENLDKAIADGETIKWETVELRDGKWVWVWPDV